MPEVVLQSPIILRRCGTQFATTLHERAAPHNRGGSRVHTNEKSTSHIQKNEGWYLRAMIRAIGGEGDYRLLHIRYSLAANIDMGL